MARAGQAAVLKSRPKPSSGAHRIFALQVAKTDHDLGVFIPKRQARAFQAFDECYSPRAVQLGHPLEAFLQAVVGHLAVEVMDMMHADVRRDPLQKLGKTIVGAAEKGGLIEAPVPLSLPVGVLVLVL